MSSALEVEKLSDSVAAGTSSRSIERPVQKPVTGQGAMNALRACAKDSTFRRRMPELEDIGKLEHGDVFVRGTNESNS